MRDYKLRRVKFSVIEELPKFFTPPLSLSLTQVESFKPHGNGKQREKTTISLQTTCLNLMQV